MANERKRERKLISNVLPLRLQIADNPCSCEFIPHYHYIHAGVEAFFFPLGTSFKIRLAIVKTKCSSCECRHARTGNCKCVAGATTMYSFSCFIIDRCWIEGAGESETAKGKSLPLGFNDHSCIWAHTQSASFDYEKWVIEFSD